MVSDKQQASQKLDEMYELCYFCAHTVLQDSAPLRLDLLIVCMIPQQMFDLR